MLASGVPVPRRDHAEAFTDLALKLRDQVATKEFEGRRIRLRIGINFGPVLAGIIGTHKFAYDLWGDVVNTASRMESEGVPGSIQISGSTFSLIEQGSSVNGAASSTSRARERWTRTVSSRDVPKTDPPRRRDDADRERARRPRSNRSSRRAQPT
jgi:class 3 adenylate cyclase